MQAERVLRGIGGFLVIRRNRVSVGERSPDGFLLVELRFRKRKERGRRERSKSLSRSPLRHSVVVPFSPHYRHHLQPSLSPSSPALIVAIIVVLTAIVTSTRSHHRSFQRSGIIIVLVALQHLSLHRRVAAALFATCRHNLHHRVACPLRNALSQPS